MNIKKVDYSDYKDKYDESIKAKLATSPESIDIETMRENLYGYTFTEDYAKGVIPDEFSMDYWESMLQVDNHKHYETLDFEDISNA